MPTGTEVIGHDRFVDSRFREGRIRRTAAKEKAGRRRTDPDDPSRTWKAAIRERQLSAAANDSSGRRVLSHLTRRVTDVPKDLPSNDRRNECREWVATRLPSLRIHRRKAVSETSLPEAATRQRDLPTQTGPSRFLKRPVAATADNTEADSRDSKAIPLLDRQL